jgi:hypothetical protein
MNPFHVLRLTGELGQGERMSFEQLCAKRRGERRKHEKRESERN